MRRITLSACAVALATLTMGHPASAASEAELAGAYSLVPERSDDIAAAIESAVAKMSFLTRPIARSRLQKTNPAYSRVRIARAEDSVEVAFDARKPVRMPADGSAIKWTREDGEQFDVSARWRDGTLEQSFAAEDGQRTNTFRLGDDGTLTLDVAITSERLPQPVRYALVYRRESPAP